MIFVLGVTLNRKSKKLFFPRTNFHVYLKYLQKTTHPRFSYLGYSNLMTLNLLIYFNKLSH